MINDWLTPEGVKIIEKLANVNISFVDQLLPNYPTFEVGGRMFQVLVDGNSTEEVKANTGKELTRLEEFKKSIEAKLANERFVQNAKPEVVERERKKLSDTQTSIDALKKFV